MGVCSSISLKMVFVRGFIIVLILCLFQDQAWGADCKVFKKKCQALCIEQSGGVSSAQCWGNPLYCHYKASDGTTFHIDGFKCENASPTSIDLCKQISMAFKTKTTYIVSV